MLERMGEAEDARENGGGEGGRLKMLERMGEGKGEAEDARENGGGEGGRLKMLERMGEGKGGG